MNALTRINQLMKAKGLADRSQFFVRIGDLPNDTCLVMQMHTLPEQPLHLHADYQIETIVVFNNAVEKHTLVGQTATIEMLYGGGLHPWHGVITGMSDNSTVGGHETYRLQIGSPLSLLKYHQHNRTFTHRDALSVALDVLQERLGHLCHISASAKPPEPAPFITQYHETDYDFIRRILAKEGIILHLSEHEDQTHIQLINSITETQEAETHITLPFIKNAGAVKDSDAISSIQQAWHNAPKQITLDEYNPDTLENLLSTHRNGQPGNAGEAEHWGLDYQTAEQGKALVERIAKNVQLRSNLIKMHTTARAIRPGNRISVTRHPELNGDYHVISVHFVADQTARTGGASSKAFETIVTAIPVAVDFVPNYHPASNNATLFTGHITEEIDDAGQYRFSYPFDHSEQEQSSPPTRMMQPFGGANHGMHFPLEKGTEVVVSALNGNLNKPLIMGALYNRNSPNVVTESNRHHNLIRTRAGHELLFNDTPEQESIQLNTPDNLNRLRLDATQSQNHIELHTEEGDLELFAGQNIRITTGKNSDLSVGEDHIVEIKNDQQLLTEEGDIGINAGADIQMTAGQNMHWQAHEGEATIIAKGNITLQNDGMRTDQTNDGNYEILVDNGDCLINASGQISLESDDMLTLTAGNSTFQLTGNNVIITGDDINITADTIAIRGGNAGNN